MHIISFFAWILICISAIQRSDQCTTLIVVENAKSTGSMTGVNIFNVDECKRYLLNDEIRKTASWNRASNSCQISDQVANNIVEDNDNDLFFYISQSSDCSCPGNKITEWHPVRISGLPRRLSVESTSHKDISSCGSNSTGKDFAFDFSRSPNCFKLLGPGTNNYTFSPLTYIYTRNFLFYWNCTLENKTLVLQSTPYVPTPTPVKTTNQQAPNVTMPTPAKMTDQWNPLAIRPAYVVLLGLGGGCLVMTLVAVTVLCQGKLGGGGGETTRPRSYSNANTEPVEISNHAYSDDDHDHKDQRDSSQEETDYFNRTEVID